MDINPTQSPGLTAAQSAAVSDASAMISSDFETFLSMLTTQMQNQDPLNPMDSTDFATQLATFSGVEQQVRTNDLLGEVRNGLAQMGLGQLSGWIGMEARAEMPARFDGTPLEIAATPPLGADRMELVVTDANGTIMQRSAIPVSAESFQWAGVTNDGQPLPPGTYAFTVEAFDDDILIGAQTAQVYAQITEAQLRDGAVWLTTQGGVDLPADAVRGLRAP